MPWVRVSFPLQPQCICFCFAWVRASHGTWPTPLLYLSSLGGRQGIGSFDCSMRRVPISKLPCMGPWGTPHYWSWSCPVSSPCDRQCFPGWLWYQDSMGSVWTHISGGQYSEWGSWLSPWTWDPSPGYSDLPNKMSPNLNFTLKQKSINSVWINSLKHKITSRKLLEKNA
jgi:hypothetical protein